MSNTRAILQIDSPENLLLIVQANPNGGREWHFSPRSGQNSFGAFRYVSIPAARIMFFDQRARIVMALHGVPSRAQDAFPFLMEDQRNALSGELDVIGESLPLRVDTYSWSVRQVIPSAYIQAAR